MPANRSISGTPDVRADLIDRIAVELHDQEGDIIEGNYAVAAEFVLDAALEVIQFHRTDWSEVVVDLTTGDSREVAHGS